jgi:hypothetical protein
MKIVSQIIASSMILAGMVGMIMYTYFSPKVTILKQGTENGYISVIYTQYGETWALDYLTKQELDSLKNVK